MGFGRFVCIVLFSRSNTPNMKKNILLLFLMFAGIMAYSQEFGFGVKAGLSFSSVDGDTDPGEAYGYRSGFHVGPTFTIRYTDEFGMRAEVLYNQLGTTYDYEGPSYFVLRNETDNRNVRGSKDMNYNTFLSYIDIPLQVYYRFGDVLEVFGGANLMILAGGTAAGRVKFSTPLSRDDIDSGLDYSYNSDNARSGVGGETQTVTLGGIRYDVPETLGAYYDHQDKDGRSWNTLDYGLHGGVRVLFNEALYLEGKAYFGFNDVSNNDMDIRQYVPDGAQLISLSDDDDRNIVFSASLGFSF